MAHITAFTDHGATLTLYFWINDVVEGRLEPRTQAYLAILDHFREHGIELAAPVREVSLKRKQTA